jgi:hypothetical protein
MSQSSKRKKLLRTRKEQRTLRRAKRAIVGEEFAMLAAGIDDPLAWLNLPGHMRQLYRVKAQMAMSVFE